MTDEDRLDVPREDLIRMSPIDPEDLGDGNTLFGYAALFNEPTVIDSWEGNFVEVIAPGAFRKTLKERGDQVKVLFNHGMDPSIGDKPLGKPTVMQEDDKGLAVEVPLSATSYNEDIKALLRDQALDGMSFRMTVINDVWDNVDATDGTLPKRTIKEVRLYEFGPVTFPAYAATVAGVRAHAPRAFEAFRAMTLDPTKGGVLVPGTPPEPIAADAAPAAATEAEPADATRSNDDAAATSGTPSTYIPAQRQPMSPERRQSQRGFVQALLAQHDQRTPK